MFEGIDPHAEAGWKGADDVLDGEEEEEIEARHSNGNADHVSAGRYHDRESIRTAESDSDGNKNRATHMEESTAGRA